MNYCPDDLERCPTHPDGRVRHIFDAKFYVWPDGHTSQPISKQTVGYECAECCRALAHPEPATEAKPK